MVRSLVVERVAAGERQTERFLGAGRAMAGERHLAATPPFAAVVLLGGGCGAISYFDPDA